MYIVLIKKLKNKLIYKHCTKYNRFTVKLSRSLQQVPLAVIMVTWVRT